MQGVESCRVQDPQTLAWGATDFNSVIVKAAVNNHIGIVKQCKKWGCQH